MAVRPNIIPSPYLTVLFAPVVNAVEYRISRAAEGEAEVAIFQGPVSAFLYLADMCALGAPIPFQKCTYLDWTIKPNVIYTYWVRTIYSHDVASPPSAPATAYRTQ